LCGLFLWEENQPVICPYGCPETRNWLKWPEINALTFIVNVVSFVIQMSYKEKESWKWPFTIFTIDHFGLLSVVDGEHLAPFYGIDKKRSIHLSCLVLEHARIAQF